MLGRLSNGQALCLEARLGEAVPLTTKRKISRVLMANAFGRRDLVEWERLVKRHLDQYEQSDPDLCYRYAVYLARDLPNRATGAIFWADRALENRTVWVGDIYTSRVFSLYKVRAVAAQSLWRRAEENLTSDPEKRGDVDGQRATTKVFAREWLEYAQAANKDKSKALALCRSAAATQDYCTM